jgi:hypothetical protein
VVIPAEAVRCPRRTGPVDAHRPIPGRASWRLHLVRTPPPSDALAGEPVEWRLAVGRLTDSGLEGETLVGDLVIPFLYPYLGMSAGCA